MSSITKVSLIEIIQKTPYVQRNHSCNTTKDPNSLSAIIKKKLTQQQCIKLGTAIEHVILNLILQTSLKFKNIKPKNRKGQHEMDHLFMNEEDKKIVYAELKSNLNLDTEKTKATILKCISNYNYLKELYPDYTIEWCLLGLRFTENNEIPNVTRKKYSEIQNNLVSLLFLIDIYIQVFITSFF